jgi:endonuclease YncB( thermonuclease family)
VSDKLWSWPGSRAFNVVDGDTIDFELPLDVGFGARTVHRVRCRLARIDAPPGMAPLEFTRHELWLSTTCTVTTLEPYSYGGPKWSPGEWMVEVVLTDGRNLSDELVKAGLAVYWNGKGKRPSAKEKAS